LRLALLDPWQVSRAEVYSASNYLGLGGHVPQGGPQA
jgi:hypothetical protein